MTEMDDDDGGRSLIFEEDRDQSDQNNNRNSNILNNNNNNLMVLQHHSNRLSSYGYNIQKARRQFQRKELPNEQQQQRRQPSTATAEAAPHGSNRNRFQSNAAIDNVNHDGIFALTKPVRSLVAFFKQQPLSKLDMIDFPQQQQVGGRESAEAVASLFVNAWKGAIIEALRAAGEANDHVLILRLVDACCQYAPLQQQQQYPELRLPPRWLGEAMEALSRTQANTGKVKQLWQLTLQQAQQQRLSGPLSAFELNVACKALARRGKPRAALDLYRSSSIAGDGYTATTLINILSDSIVDDQEPLAFLPTLSSDTDSSTTTATGSCWSVCWQWNEAQILLQELSHVLNNHVISAALQLNERATQVFGTARARLFDSREGGEEAMPQSEQETLVHDGATIALNLLQRMMEEWKLTPDVVTCSCIMSALEKAFRYQDACTLLQDMKRGGRWAMNATTWLTLPSPNVYTYSLVISACAKCQQDSIALDLLEDMRMHGPAPNTWVYNAAIAATTTNSNTPSTEGQGSDNNDSQSNNHVQPATPLTAQRHQQQEQPVALRLLRQMQHDAKHGLDTLPDTVTYNSVLAAFDGSPRNNNKHIKNIDDAVVLNLLQEMKQTGVARDHITYRHAILACQANADLVLDLLDRAIDDNSRVTAAPLIVRTETKSTKAHYEKVFSRTPITRSSHGFEIVVHGAMSVLASRGDWMRVCRVFQKMKEVKLRPNKETWSFVLMALGRSGQAALIPTMLQAMMGDQLAATTFWDATNVNLPVHGVLVDADLYSAAISACLEANESHHALQVLSMMKSQGLAPTAASLEAITYAYARLALVAAAEETKERRQRMDPDDHSDNNQRVLLIETQRVSAARALTAFRLVQTLENAPAKLLSSVARACASAQLWQQAQVVLRLLHGRAIRESGHLKHDTVKVLPELHRSLLKLCASQGNVTAALWYVEDIQGVARRLSPAREHSTPKISDCESVDMVSSRTEPNVASKVDIAIQNIGMKAEDWKLLIIAASKSGHWKVCINSLQILQPIVEQTRPSSLPRSSAADEFQKLQNYDGFSRALIGTVLCLEMKSQFGWVVRVMDDWMSWSGRRPPLEAVSSAFRVLATRSHGEEVTKMLDRILQVRPELHIAPDATAANSDSYDENLYIIAITALHNNGLYDDADSVYVMATAQGNLEYDIAKNDTTLTLDLHGMNVAIAHAAVRITFQQEILTASWSAWNHSPHPYEWDKDILIVTGRGRNSAERMRPVLRPEIQRMLLEEFYPPLSTVSVPGNMGAIRVHSADIKAWLSHQREQRNVQLLAAANALKEVSSGNSLRRSIAFTLRHSAKQSPGQHQPRDGTNTSEVPDSKT